MARRISSPIHVGRETELQACRVALEEAQARRPGLLLVGGEAGIGKSRLVTEYAELARAAGGFAAVGAVPPPAGEVRVPLAGLVPLLRGLLRSVDARLLDRHLGPVRGDLATLLPELGPPPAEVHSPYAATRLAEAVLVAVESVAQRRGLLLLALEDLHWADDATRATLLYVCRGLADAPVVVVLTYRTDLAAGGDELSDTLAELARGRSVERLELEPLSPEGVAAQVRAITGSDPAGPLLRELTRRSGGVPFYVEELLVEMQAASGTGPPSSVRAAVEARSARLAPAARSVVQLLGVAGTAVPVGVLQRAAGLPAADLVVAIDDAIRSHFAAWVPAGDVGVTDTLDLRHVLVREAILASLNGPRRRELHRALAEALQVQDRSGGSADPGHATLLATQWLLAGDDARAVPVLLEQAAGAEQRHAFATASMAYESALDAWDRLAATGDTTVESSRPMDRLDTLERAAHAASLAGHPGVALRRVREAVAGLGNEASMRDREHLARLIMYRARFEMEAGELTAALSSVDDALAASAPDSLLRARGLTLRARLLVASGRQAEALEEASQARHMAESLGGKREAGQARAAQAAALAQLGRLDEALELITAGAEGDRTSMSTRSMSFRPSRLIGDLQAYLDRASVLERAGDLAQAARVARDGALMARGRGLGDASSALLVAVAARDLLAIGAWDEAAALAAPETAQGPDEATAAVRLVRARLATRRGEWAAAEAELANVESGRAGPLDTGWLAQPSLVRAEMATSRHHLVEGRAVLADGIAVAEGAGEVEALAALAMLAVRIEADDARVGVGRRAGASLRGPDTASELWLRVRIVLEGPPRTSDTPRSTAYRATAAAELTRLEGGVSVSAWEDAARSWEVLGDTYEAAHCRWRLAEALVAQAGSRTSAREALLTARATAERLGARPLGGEVEWLARRARLVDPGSRELPKPGTGGAFLPGEAQARSLGLSEREAEVLALVAEGLTDREIGERLFITTKTAGHHVSHILTKLSVDRRGEAAAVAFRIGLLAETR